MGRKITMTGKNAQYIERRGAYATPDNDREIIMEGDEAVYQEFVTDNIPVKKKEPKKILSEFSWIYMFFVVVGVILAILIPLIPAIPDAVKPLITDGTDPILYLEVSVIITVLMDLWYFWLLRRYTSGKSNGTLLMVLLAIGVVGNLISIFMTNGTATFMFVIDAVVLYYLYSSKKQGK